MNQSESGRIRFTEQAGRLWNSTGKVLSVTLFLVEINSILGELGNWVGGSLFVDNLAIYINKKSESGNQSSAGSDQQAGCMGSVEGLDIFTEQNSKHDI